jgi:hypothetical protein
MTGPWTFDEARTASVDGHDEQERVEGLVGAAYKDYARKERLYSVALARKMLDLKRSGVAITACERLAKGDEKIAELREERDIAEGVKETAKHAAWRAAADRRDTESLIDWSKRRNLAEGYDRGQQPAWSGGTR